MEGTQGEIALFHGCLYYMTPFAHEGNELVVTYKDSPLERHCWAPEGFVLEHKGKMTYYATKLALGVFRSDKIRYRIWKSAEQRIARYGTEQCNLVASFGEGTSIMKMRFPTEWFRTPAIMDFEGHPMPVPANVDEYLRISFGDYMQLPPEEDRVARHSAVFIDLDNSYTEYKGIHYCVKK